MELQSGWFLKLSSTNGEMRCFVYRGRIGTYVGELKGVPQNSESALELFINAQAKKYQLHASPNDAEPGGFDLL